MRPRVSPCGPDARALACKCARFASLGAHERYAEKMHAHPDEGPNLLTFVWFGMTLAGMCGTLAVGPILAHYGNQAPYLLALLPAAGACVHSAVPASTPNPKALRGTLPLTPSPNPKPSTPQPLKPLSAVCCATAIFWPLSQNHLGDRREHPQATRDRRTKMWQQPMLVFLVSAIHTPSAAAALRWSGPIEPTRPAACEWLRMQLGAT